MPNWEQAWSRMMHVNVVLTAGHHGLAQEMMGIASVAQFRIRVTYDFDTYLCAFRMCGGSCAEATEAHPIGTREAQGGAPPARSLHPFVPAS